MSLLKAIHDDIHFCHSNQERLAEVLRFEFACGQHGGRGNGGKSKRDGSKGRGGKKGDAKAYSYQQDLEKGMFCDGYGAEGHSPGKLPGPSLPRGVLATHGAEGEEGFERSLRFQVW